MLRDQGYGAGALYDVSVYTQAFAGSKLYTTWWQVGVNNLPKVVMQQCGVRESNSRPLSH